MKTILRSVVALIGLCTAGLASAQFSVGSTGANGVFPPGALPEGTTEIVLDLRDGTLTFNPSGSQTVIQATPSGGFADGFLNFSSVNVPEGVTLRFVNNLANTPVTMLSQTDVSIAGVIDLSGKPGRDGGEGGNNGGGEPGPGGFRGGNGELLEGNDRAGTGFGPGGGRGATTSNGGSGGVGRIRFESFTFTYDGSRTGIASFSGQGIVQLPNQPTIEFTSVGGNGVPAEPRGNRGGVDIVIDQPGTVTVALAARKVPTGTTLEVTAKAEQDGPVIGPVLTGGLTGSFDNSTATVDITFPQSGVYFLEARATFTTQ